jgi:hypothetical protein
MQDWTFIIIGIIVVGALIYLLSRSSSSAVGDPNALQADARRIARLLVAEIKLYNEAKIERGKRANDIYSQLETEINDARKMYDRRMRNNLTDKDYFDEQIIELLADGDASKMGARYAESKKQ